MNIFNKNSFMRPIGSRVILARTNGEMIPVVVTKNKYPVYEVEPSRPDANDFVPKRYVSAFDSNTLLIHSDEEIDKFLSLFEGE